MTLYGILNIVYFAFFGIIFVPVGVGLVRLARLSNPGRRAWLFLVLLMLNESTSIILQYCRIRNHFMLQSDSLIVLWAGSGFFLALFAGEKPALLRRAIVPIAGLITVLLVVEVATGDGFNQINTVTFVLSRLFVLVFSFLGLKKLFNALSNSRLEILPAFWYCIGFFIFSFFSAVSGAFEKQFIMSSLNLYYFFDTLKVIAYGTSFAIFAIGLYRDNGRSPMTRL